jgi:hypothetical protein
MPGNDCTSLPDTLDLFDEIGADLASLRALAMGVETIEERYWLDPSLHCLGGAISRAIDRVQASADSLHKSWK